MQIELHDDSTMLPDFSPVPPYKHLYTVTLDYGPDGVVIVPLLSNHDDLAVTLALQGDDRLQSFKSTLDVVALADPLPLDVKVVTRTDGALTLDDKGLTWGSVYFTD